jgi:hypothetical protein
MSSITRGSHRQQRSARRGAVAAEMAIVLPIFILAFIGILEFGRAIMLQQILVNAAREGARRAIVPGATTDEVKKLIVGDPDEDEPGYLEQAGLGTNGKIAIWDEDGNDLELEDANSHDLIQVVVQVPYNGFTSYFTNTKMRARVQMRKE